jgi:hypothetical protein
VHLPPLTGSWLASFLTNDKDKGVGVGWFLFGVWRLARYKIQVGCEVIASYCGVLASFVF